MRIADPQAGDTPWSALTDDIVTCRACPRLVAWRERVAREKRRAYRDWDYWGRPVPGFGDPAARMLIVGLAPGAHGSNRTGRMFTGDSSGDTLYAALNRAGIANQPSARQRDDGLTLTDAFITAIARCAPPGNRPTAEELASCRPFLAREWALMPQVRVVVALGQMAFDGWLRLLRDVGYNVPRLKFGHGLHYSFDPPPSAFPLRQTGEGALPGEGVMFAGGGGHDMPFGYSATSLKGDCRPLRADYNNAGEFEHLIASYHPSRQNTQTGRLTPGMLDEVFALARSLLEA